jgi:hypothetical protein
MKDRRSAGEAPLLTTANVARDHVKCSSMAAGGAVASLALPGYPGALGHLPVVYGMTGGDPGCQFGDVLRVLIHLKYVNFNQGAFQVSDVGTSRRYQPEACQRPPQPDHERG